MKNLFLLTMIGAFLCTTEVKAQELLVRDSYCSYTDETSPTNVYTFNSDEEANNTVEKILKYTGLKKNFIIKAANVSNAEASISGTTRYILYNQNFILQIRNATNTNWSAISIMAHEIGHHLQGHTLLRTGSRPNIELEADKYSGFILQKMGATLEQAKAAMSLIAGDQDSETHPGKQARLAAITNGWMEAKDLASPPTPDSKPDSTPAQQPTTQPSNPQPGTPSPSTVFYVSRCVFNNDPNSYYITNTNQIVSFNQYGQAVIIGQKNPPTYTNFAWMYQTPYITYGVDFQGYIYGTYPNGQLMIVGYVTNP